MLQIPKSRDLPVFFVIAKGCDTARLNNRHSAERFPGVIYRKFSIGRVDVRGPAIKHWRESTVGQSDIKTKGKVISRLAPITDFIENLIYLGRLEQVWQRLISKAELARGERVVDVGCGTGKVAIAAADMVLPGGEVFGIDASAEMIAMSRKRATAESVEVAFHQDVMEDLPFPDDNFDVVLSCQALHHVPRDAKFQALSEMRRVLRPGGRLLLLDHGQPYRWNLKILFYPFRWNILEYQAENFRGQIPEMIASVFGDVEEVDRFFGWMRTWRAVKS